MEFKSTPFILCGAEQHSEVQVCLLLANNGFSSHLFAFSPFHSSNSQFRSIHFYHHHCHLYKFIWGFIFASISSCFVASSKNKLRANLRRLWCLRLLSVILEKHQLGTLCFGQYCNKMEDEKQNRPAPVSSDEMRKGFNKCKKVLTHNYREWWCIHK